MNKLLFIFVISLCLSHALTASDNVFNLIKQIGFHPMKSEATDFSLSDLSGQETNLSSYKGKWVFLNFFATWCGPCKIEMPTLEGLKEELKDKNIEVIGISIDQGDPLKIKHFIKQTRITFKILHDATGKVASSYQASSVPSVYLISPDLELVGVLRGAIDWENSTIIELVRRLANIKQIPENVFPEKLNKSSNTPIPEILIPPVMNIISPKETPFINETQKIIISINWKGDPSKYLVKVPEIKLPSGVILGNISSNTVASTSKATLQYIYPLKFTKSGKFKIGPITLNYSSRSDSGKQFSRHPGFEISIADKNYIKQIIWSISILASVLFFIIIGIIIKKKRTSANLSNIDNNADLKLKFQEIKKIKIQGNPKKYLEELLKLYRIIILSREGDSSQINDLLEKISFGGELVTPQKATYYEKEIERMLNPEIED